MDLNDNVHEGHCCCSRHGHMYPPILGAPRGAANQREPDSTRLRRSLAPQRSPARYHLTGLQICTGILPCGAQHVGRIMELDKEPWSP